MKEPELSLTDEELSKVNTIISGIQSDLELAISSINSGNWDKALDYVHSGISRSSCPKCKKELGILIADIEHNKSICILDDEMCDTEKRVILDKTKELKDDFVPITATKKALRDKVKTIKETKSKSIRSIDEVIRNLFPIPQIKRF